MFGFDLQECWEEMAICDEFAKICEVLENEGEWLPDDDVEAA